MKLNCMQCGTEFEGEEPLMCCSSRDFSCMDMPVDPIVCDGECFELLLEGKNSLKLYQVGIGDTIECQQEGNYMGEVEVKSIFENGFTYNLDGEEVQCFWNPHYVMVNKKQNDTQTTL
jgi:hypothetical protein